MNIYTIRVTAEVEVFANSDYEAIEKVHLQLSEDVANNAEVSIFIVAKNIIN